MSWASDHLKISFLHSCKYGVSNLVTLNFQKHFERQEKSKTVSEIQVYVVFSPGGVVLIPIPVGILEKKSPVQILTISSFC